MSTILLVVAGLVGLVLVESLVSGRRAGASRTGAGLALGAQLPDALALLARGLRAGHPVGESVNVAARELPAPLGPELARVAKDTVDGMPLDAALRALADRHPSQREFRLVAVGVAIQQDAGGNLVELLENLARTTRERLRFAARLRAASAGGRVSAMIAALAPLVFLAAMVFIYPEHLVLLREGDGRLIAAGAASLWVLGALWTRAIVQVKY